MDFIRKRLEKALDSLRTSRGALGETGTSKGKAQGILLGNPNEPFTLAQLGARVSIASTSTEGEPGLGAVRDFLQTSAK